MIDKFCDFLTNKIRKESPEIDDERAEVINYGIHLIVGEIPKFFIIMGIACLLGILKETLISYVVLMPFRGASGGFHLKSHLGCITATVVFYSTMVLFAKYLTLYGIAKYIFAFIVWLFGMLMVKIYAPADTENVPIISKSERKKKKVLSYITLTGSIIASFFIKDPVVSNIIIYGMLLQSLTLTRLAYKLTNNKYGYEVYKASQELL